MDPISDEVKSDKNQSRKMLVRKALRVLGAFGRFLFIVFVSVAALSAGFCLQAYLYFTKDLPSVEKLKDYSPPIVSYVYDDQGKAIADFASQRRFVVPINEIPIPLQQAFVSGEDKNFWEHPGVHWEAIILAIKLNIMKSGYGVGSGASTITRQEARYFLLAPEKKFVRKIKEAILSVRIEKSFDKKEILYLYLNEIYLGSGAYGVEAAARTYFGKHVGELTLAECAMIGGLARAPGRYSPRRNLHKALERRAYVLKRMLEDDYISKKQCLQALDEEVRLAPKENPYPTEASDFVEHVRRYVVQKYGSDALHKEGLQIYTSCNVDMTRAAVEAVDRGLRELDKRQGYRGPIKQLAGRQIAEFLDSKNNSPEKPLAAGDIADGVITRIDADTIHVSMGRYAKGTTKEAYVGAIKIDPSPSWWCRKPCTLHSARSRKFAVGELPFQVGDQIKVRLVEKLGDRDELSDKEQVTTSLQDAGHTIARFSLELEQEPLVQAALMMLENRSGYIRVLLGGHSGSSTEFNRATQYRRQAGSTFKPVIYAAALNHGLSPEDIVLDCPSAVTRTGKADGLNSVLGPPPPVGSKPDNSSDNCPSPYAGPVTVRNALAHSRNIPTIKILQDIGLDQAKAYARKLGYRCSLPDDLTLALGNVEVSLEEQMNVYSVFANNGYAVPGVYIKKIVDRHGHILEEHHPPVFSDEPDTPKVQPVTFSPSDRTPSGTKIATKPAGVAYRVIDEAITLTMTDMLRGVVQEGTANTLTKILDCTDIAGKTGTTRGYRDAWFVGYTPAYTAGVWVGFDDVVSLGEDETGGKVAAPIWGRFMKHVLKDGS